MHIFAPDLPEVRAGRPAEDVERGKGGAPRGMNVGTAARVAKAVVLIEDEDRSKGVACDLADVNLKTFNRWQDDPEVKRAIARLRKERERA